MTQFTNPKTYDKKKPFWERRLETCYECKWVRGEGMTLSCKMCGCFLQAKTRAWMMHCPLKKW